MDEFQNRMSAQREILKIVNRTPQAAEGLCGLSEYAICRWATANELGTKSEAVVLLRKAAELLYFLATKSQEQVTDEYRARMQEVAIVTGELRRFYNHQFNRTRNSCFL